MKALLLPLLCLSLGCAADTTTPSPVRLPDASVAKGDARENPDTVVVAVDAPADAPASRDTGVDQRPATVPDASLVTSDVPTTTPRPDGATTPRPDGAATPRPDGGAWVVCPQPGEEYPPACRAWQGTPLPFEGALPRCPFDQPGRDPKPFSAYSCLEYCACWFTGESKCAAFKGIPWGRPHQSSSTMAVYPSVGACLAACQEASPGQRAQWAYEANNNDFHCPKAVPAGVCPFVADEICRDR